jgi:hypothetical protein
VTSVLGVFMVCNKVVQYLARQQAYAEYHEYQQCFDPEYIF